MSQYIEEALDKMLKGELIPIALSLQNKITLDNNAMLQEMLKLNNNFTKLEAELVINKRVNSELCKCNATSVLGKSSVLKKRIFGGDWNTSASR